MKLTAINTYYTNENLSTNYTKTGSDPSGKS